MMRRTTSLKKIFSISLIATCTLCFQSCFTGVEGTKKISLSKQEVLAVAPSPEDKFLAEISFQPVGDWNEGKKLLVTDDKFRLIVENASGAGIGRGDTIVFQGVASSYGADGNEQSMLKFAFRNAPVVYIIDKSLSETMSSVKASDIPMVVDLDLIEKVREKLIGHQVWTRTALWLDDSMTYKKGRKFVPITFTGVEAGDSFFPVSVSFKDADNNEGRLLMNLGNSGNESRNFSKLFSLSDPRVRYKHISKENWEAIQNESLRIGMTKEECRLSIGNPSDVDTGHNYSNAMEIWFYHNGSYLRFVDGLLIGYK